MPPHEKLANSLSRLKELHDTGRTVFRSEELSRTDRERLSKHGYLREMMKGWLFSADPAASDGDTTPYYASFWEFCAAYCGHRFGDDWHLSGVHSLLLLTEDNTVPKQVTIVSPRASNNVVSLAHGTTLLALKLPTIPRTDRESKLGVTVMSVAPALVQVPESFFVADPAAAQAAMSMVRDGSTLVRKLLEGGHSVVAGRLAGAFRRVGRNDVADAIVGAMESADYEVRETDPFADPTRTIRIDRPEAPISTRIRALWKDAQVQVATEFRAEPLEAVDAARYMSFVDDEHRADSYHSLSIEGYRVTPELIERVRTGKWDPEARDQRNRDALAARGYFEAFRVVKNCIDRVVRGEAIDLWNVHGEWYRKLFAPSVAAGLLEPAALAGYRRHAVYLRGSRHVPPRSEVVSDAMRTLFDLTDAESDPRVKAVLGHWLFGYIHPYPDGNGRMARFLMNVLLAQGGYPWTIIRVDDRDEYLSGLESASVDHDLRPLTQFISAQVTRARAAYEARG